MDSQKLQWHGATMYDRNDDKIGTIDQIYVDVQTNEPEWALVNTGLFGMSSSFVPLARAEGTADGVRVPYDKDKVKDAPRLSDDRELSTAEERDLYSYYGMGYGDAGGATTGRGTTADATRGHDTSGPDTDQAMTRSEEELHVGTRSRETGRARLRKHIVTEHVTETVPISRETAHVEREPITDANVGAAMDGPELSEEEHEVVLTEEVPVAEKRTVPKERVRVDVDRETGQAQVDEDVRREEIDLEVDDVADNRR